MIKFAEVYVATVNKREKELSRTDATQAVERQTENLRQQREALVRCVFGRKRAGSGRRCKFAFEHADLAKSGPWFEFLESPRVLSKLETVNALDERLRLVQKRLAGESRIES